MYLAKQKLGAITEPFTFNFSAGIVSMVGAAWNFDLNRIINSYYSKTDLDGSSLGTQLLAYLYDGWNKTFNPTCCVSYCDRDLGANWNVQCLHDSGTPNLLSAAGEAILPQIRAWTTAWLQARGPISTGSPAPTPSGGGGSFLPSPGGWPGGESGVGQYSWYIIVGIAIVAVFFLMRR